MHKKLPYLEVSGTHQQVGEGIGETFKTFIQADILEMKQTIPEYSSLLEKCKPYYEITKNYLPHIMDELEAIAWAAGVSSLEYFFINNREVYDSMEEHDRRDASSSDHCTVIVGFDNSNLIVGHNEDWSLDALENLYVLKATIGGTTFMGLNYCTVVAGLAASMNNWGLVQCINDVHSVKQMGVPKNFIARAVLECKTLDEAESIIRSLPRASGFNHVLAQANEIRNIEIAGDIIAIERVFNKPYAHTNHYLTPELKEVEAFHTNSSEARYIRANELMKNSMKKEDIIAILSDTTNAQYPICRADETIGSAILVPKHKKAYFCYGHPCEGEFVEYTL